MKIIEAYQYVVGTDRKRTYNYGVLQVVRYRKDKCLRFIVPSQEGYNGEDGTTLTDMSHKEFNQKYSLKPLYGVVQQPA